MTILNTVAELHSWCASHRSNGASIGFVPTMGYLHEGHLALVRQSKQDNDVSLASIFVNPAQFAPSEDLARYPRDFDRDCSLLSSVRCDALFAPAVSDIYPDGFATRIHVDGVGSDFEGAVRPSHFDGVALVVTRLLCMTTPSRLYLGQKDLQQTAVLRRLVSDLGLPCSVIIVPTVRDTDGLALSSRNSYLDAHERTVASIIPHTLHRVLHAVQAGERDCSILENIARSSFGSQPGVSIDYIAFVHPRTMQPVASLEGQSEAACMVAVRVGSTRLLDNCFLHDVDAAFS